MRSVPDNIWPMIRSRFVTAIVSRLIRKLLL
jgi:hypothetical protein